MARYLPRLWEEIILVTLGTNIMLLKIFNIKNPNFGNITNKRTVESDSISTVEKTVVINTTHFDLEMISFVTIVCFSLNNMYSPMSHRFVNFQ